MLRDELPVDWISWDVSWGVRGDGGQDVGLSGGGGGGGVGLSGGGGGGAERSLGSAGLHVHELGVVLTVSPAGGNHDS